MHVPLGPLHNDMDVDGAAAPAAATSSKRRATAPAGAGAGSGDTTSNTFLVSASGSFLAAPFKFIQQPLRKAMQQQGQQYVKLIKDEFQLSAKLTSLQAMKDAGHLPKNLQFSPPNIYGEQMGSVQQSAGAKLKQVGQELLDEMITNITQQRDAARDKAAALRQGDAATAVKAAYPGLPDAWGGPFCQNMFNQVQSSILMELDLKLAAAYDAMTAAAQRKQQQAQEKAAKAAAAAAAAAPLTAEEQVRRIAAEEAKKLLQKQKKAPPAAGAQHQPRKQRAQQQQPAQGQPRPAGRGGRPQQPAQKPQQQQQQQQRPHKRRQGPAPGGAPTYAAAARGGPKPVNAGQRPRPQQQGPRF
jgi:hypothetical protein